MWEFTGYDGEGGAWFINHRTHRTFVRYEYDLDVPVELCSYLNSRGSM